MSSPVVESSLEWIATSLNKLADCAVNIEEALREQNRPSTRLNLGLSCWGTHWVAHHAGIEGSGDSPEEAYRAFDIKWYKKLGKT